MADLEELWRIADVAQAQRDEEKRLRKAEYDKQWRRDNPEAAKERHRKHVFKYKYNLTLEEYDELLTLQSNCCAICKTDTPGHISGRFCVDHDKHTGKVRGLLCDNCNLTIKNHSAEHLRKCADYVEYWALKHYNLED